MRATLSEVGVPAEAQAGIMQGYAASASSPQAREEFVAGLAEQFQSQAALVAERIDSGVKASFTEAITRVYTYVLFIVVIAWVATIFIPVLPLRDTIEAAPVAD